MSPETGARLRLSVLLLFALLLQTTIVPDLRLRGTNADVMLLFGICAGLAGGAEMGAIVGFSAGLLTDLFLQTTPVGLSALTYCLIGFGVGAVRRAVFREGWLLPPAIALVASSTGIVLFVVIGSVVGQSQLTAVGPRTIIQIAVIVGVMNAVLAVPLSRIIAWAASGSAGANRVRAEGPALLK
jgi:rod shape-determining protein MreD